MTCVSEKLMSEGRPFVLVEEVERDTPSRENSMGKQGEQGGQRWSLKKCVIERKVPV